MSAGALDLANYSTRGLTNAEADKLYQVARGCVSNSQQALCSLGTKSVLRSPHFTSRQVSVPEISLWVTRKVVAHTESSPSNQRQIAFRSASSELHERLSQASRHQRVKLRLGGVVPVEVGDTSAIWRAHNEEHSAGFDALFSLLASYPGQPMRFVCELE